MRIGVVGPSFERSWSFAGESPTITLETSPGSVLLTRDTVCVVGNPVALRSVSVSVVEVPGKAICNAARVASRTRWSKRSVLGTACARASSGVILKVGCTRGTERFPAGDGEDGDMSRACVFLCLTVRSVIAGLELHEMEQKSSAASKQCAMSALVPTIARKCGT